MSELGLCFKVTTLAKKITGLESISADKKDIEAL